MARPYENRLASLNDNITSILEAYPLESRPSTGPIEYVNAPAPMDEPMQVAATDKSEPQSVQESDNLLDKAYDLLGYKSGKGKYKDIEVGSSPAHPLLQQFGLVDQGREQKIQELMEAQAQIRDMVIKASKKKIDNMINPKPDISDAETQFPGAIKANAQQMTDVVPARPAIMAPATAMPQRFGYAGPHGPISDLQEATLASVIGGHLVNDNGRLLPPSVVNNEATNAPLSPEEEAQALEMLQNALRDRQAGGSSASSEPADVTVPTVQTTAAPTPLVRMRPSVFNNVLDNIRQIGLTKREQNNAKPSNLARLISERDALQPNDPNRPAFDSAIEKESSVSSIDAENQISRGVFGGSVNSIGNAPITPQESKAFERQGYRVPSGVNRQQGIEMASRQRAELIQRAGLIAKVDVDQNYKPLDKDAQLWRHSETGEAAPPGLTPAKAKEQGYINIEPQQIQTVTQINNVDAGLDAVTKAANRLVRNATGFTLIDAPAGVLQSSWLSLKRVAGNKDLADLESAIARITPGMAKLGGDTGNVAVAEREIYAKSIFSDHDTVESVLSKVSAIRNANGNTLKNIGLKPKQGQAKPEQAGGLEVGTVKKGYRFKGGDPSKKESWEKVQE